MSTIKKDFFGVIKKGIKDEKQNGLFVLYLSFILQNLVLYAPSNERERNGTRENKKNRKPFKQKAFKVHKKQREETKIKGRKSVFLGS